MAPTTVRCAVENLRLVVWRHPYQPRGCEMVLGIQWLATLGDIKCNFKALRMEFVYNNKKLVIIGTPKSPDECSQYMNHLEARLCVVYFSVVLRFIHSHRVILHSSIQVVDQKFNKWYQSLGSKGLGWKLGTWDKKEVSRGSFGVRFSRRSRRYSAWAVKFDEKRCLKFLSCRGLLSQIKVQDNKVFDQGFVQVRASKGVEGLLLGYTARFVMEGFLKVSALFGFDEGFKTNL
ncbi:hypothetical protein Tco_0269385 [Tanacetum coccineum]